jgi:hypothetical protein
VSASEINHATNTDKRRKIFTILFVRRSARYLAPLSPIAFSARASSVIVCLKKKRYEGGMEKKNHIYRIIFQCISQILRTFITDVVVCKVECNECLFLKVKMQLREKELVENRVALESLCKILRTISSNFVASKFEFGNGLCDEMKLQERKSKGNSHVPCHFVRYQREFWCLCLRCYSN